MNTRIGLWITVSLLILGTIGCGSQNPGDVIMDNYLKRNPEEGEVRDPGRYFCSSLDFSQIPFPRTMTLEDSIAFALGLNITGSFEGHEGWGTISNNFDGMGMSLGLLNQTLGTGSLQPLLLKMRINHYGEMEKTFQPDRLKSLVKMIQDWDQTGPSAMDLKNIYLSAIDVPGEVVAMGLREKKSVQWAVDNLYLKNGEFKPEWKNEITAMAELPNYVYLQLEAASGYHKKARRYQKAFNFDELRSYLFFFDIVVQGGGLYPEDIDDYETYARNNPNASAQTRMEKILDLRLRKVQPRWRSVFANRKKAIINGGGVVYQKNRNLEKQYCYQGATAY